MVSKAKKQVGRILAFALVAALFLPAAASRDFLGDFKASVSDLVIKKLLISDMDYPSKLMTRGEAVNRIVEAFDLANEKSAFLEQCMSNADECFFVFSAMSDFDGISFDPLLLYPDVNENSRYYAAINTASMLGLVHGYINEENTPFKPEIVITRIQALKILLASADLLQWKEKFELSEEYSGLPFADVDSGDPAMWWYPRYLDFALESGIIDAESIFRPDEPITLGELAEMVDRALMYKENGANDTQTYA